MEIIGTTPSGGKIMCCTNSEAVNLMEPNQRAKAWSRVNVSGMRAILAELDHAEEKHPNWPPDHIHQAAVVAEEAGELVQAALQGRFEDGPVSAIRKEAIHTAAMALRLLINL